MWNPINSLCDNPGSMPLFHSTKQLCVCHKKNTFWNVMSSLLALLVNSFQTTAAATAPIKKIILKADCHSKNGFPDLLSSGNCKESIEFNHSAALQAFPCTWYSDRVHVVVISLCFMKKSQYISHYLRTTFINPADKIMQGVLCWDTYQD